MKKIAKPIDSTTQEEILESMSSVYSPLVQNFESAHTALLSNSCGIVRGNSAFSAEK